VTFIEERKFHVGGKRSQKMKKATKYGFEREKGKLFPKFRIRRGLDRKSNRISFVSL